MDHINNYNIDDYINIEDMKNDMLQIGNYTLLFKFNLNHINFKIKVYDIDMELLHSYSRLLQFNLITINKPGMMDVLNLRRRFNNTNKLSLEYDGNSLYSIEYDEGIHYQ